MTVNFHLRDSQIIGTLNSKRFTIDYDGSVCLSFGDRLVCYEGSVDPTSSASHIVAYCEKALRQIILQGFKVLGLNWEEAMELFKSVWKMSPSVAAIILELP